MSLSFPGIALADLRVSPSVIRCWANSLAGAALMLVGVLWGGAGLPILWFIWGILKLAFTFAPMDLTVLSLNLSFSLYAVALFGFRMFDPISAARQTVIQQMQEGMLVLDTKRKIVDLNRAAERILGLSVPHVRGRDVADILPAEANLHVAKTQAEIRLGTAGASCYYELNISTLKGRKDQVLGYLVLPHDVTRQKQAQAQIMEHQRALAAYVHPHADVCSREHRLAQPYSERHAERR